MKTSDKYWLAGYLEGEGSFMKGTPSTPNSPAISVCSTDEDVIVRVAELFGVSYCEKKSYKSDRHKRVWLVRKRGYHAVTLMKLLQPLMSHRRQQQIQIAIDSFDLEKVKSHKLSTEEVVEIKKMCQTSMTQKQIAAKFGICRELVNRIKNGKAHAA